MNLKVIIHYNKKYLKQDLFQSKPILKHITCSLLETVFIFTLTIPPQASYVGVVKQLHMEPCIPFAIKTNLYWLIRLMGDRESISAT